MGIRAITANMVGKKVIILPTTTNTANAAITSTPIFGISGYTKGTFVLTVSGKVMDASTTVNVYVQHSPDGTNWDDLVSFTQITNAAIGDGVYLAWLNPSQAASAVDRAVSDGALTANTVRSIHWCEQMRVKVVPVNFAGSDTITLKVEAWLA